MRERAPASPRLPDFVLIGSMKAATSTLHDQLAEQPGIFMSDPKEPCFFSDDDVYARGLAWYAGLFADAPPGALCGESSTHYTKLPTHPQAAARLAAHLPNAKLIYIMRHPIDRLISHYVHAWTEREVKGSLDAALDELPALVHYGQYAMQLEAWFAHFERSAILPVFFERLNGAGQAELERVARFLGHPERPRWSDTESRKNVSAERLRRSPLRDALVDAPVLRTLRRALVPQSVRDRVKSLWQLRERPSLSEANRARLARIFDADLERLGSWLGAPLSCASFAETVRRGPLDWVGDA